MQLRLLGQRLSGNFGFEQATAERETALTKVVRIAASNVTLALGDGTTDYVRLTNGEAFLDRPGGRTLATAGVAGRIRERWSSACRRRSGSAPDVRAGRQHERPGHRQTSSSVDERR